MDKKKPDGTIELVSEKSNSVAETAIKEGRTVVKTEVPYVTAIKVQVPRDIDRIIKNINKECQYAGQSFYYAWDIQGKSGRSRVEGGSIGLAMALAREFGNCYCPVTLDETDDRWIFTTTFIDLETGFNLQRIYRYRKDRVIQGRYDPARAEDMAFQAAQSKAIRNVILTAMPKWLVDDAINKAKDAEIKKIDYEGIALASDKAIKFLAGYGITEDQLKQKLGKPKSEWTSEDVANLRGLAQGLKDGQIRTDDLVTQEQDSKPQHVTLEDITKPASAPKTPQIDDKDVNNMISNLRKELKLCVGDDHCYLKVIALEFSSRKIEDMDISTKQLVISELEKELAKQRKNRKKGGE